MVTYLNEETSLYRDTLESLFSNKVLNQNSTILVICGGETDQKVLLRYGFKNVVISNLDSRQSENSFLPFMWSYQDAENLNYENDYFDFCFVHEGLHHCHSPHRALLEMYRVSRIGILVVEPCENMLTKIGKFLRIGQEFEHAAVFYNDCKFGGVANTAIPNFVYRWTENEIKKTINAYSPYGVHKFRFLNKLIFPWMQLRGRKQTPIVRLFLSLTLILRILDKFSAKFGNNLSAVVLKPEFPKDLHPWIKLSTDGLELNPGYLTKKFK